MGLFDRIAKAVASVAKTVADVIAPPAPKKPTTRKPAPSAVRVSSPPPTPTQQRAAVAVDLGTDDRERDHAEIETWMQALRARGDRFAPGLLDSLESWLKAVDPDADDDIMSDITYETEKGGSL